MVYFLDGIFSLVYFLGIYFLNKKIRYKIPELPSGEFDILRVYTREMVFYVLGVSGLFLIFLLFRSDPEGNSFLKSSQVTFILLILITGMLVRKLYQLIQKIFPYFAGLSSDEVDSLYVLACVFLTIICFVSGFTGSLEKEEVGLLVGSYFTVLLGKFIWFNFKFSSISDVIKNPKKIWAKYPLSILNTFLTVFYVGIQILIAEKFSRLVYGIVFLCIVILMGAFGIYHITREGDQLKVEVTGKIRGEEAKKVTDGLSWYNKAFDEQPSPKDLAVYTRGVGGVIIGGLIGYTLGKWFHIKHLWVHQKYRHRGFGSSMLKKAEKEAAERGCQFILLDTMEYQAPIFYKKNGYQEVMTLAQYPVKGKRIYYTKTMPKVLRWKSRNYVLKKRGEKKEEAPKAEEKKK